MLFFAIGELFQQSLNKYRFLLPIGWLAEGGKYLGLLVTGKRKSKGTSKMLKEAAKRKNIYSQMELLCIPLREPQLHGV